MTPKDPTPEADRNSSFDFATWGFRPRPAYQRASKKIRDLQKKAGRKKL